MRPEITKIITTMIKSSDNYYEEYIEEGIRSLSKNWPSLSIEEKKEIEAVATAYSIMAVDNEEVDNEEINQEEFYESTTSYSKDPVVKKKSLFRRG